MRKILPMLGVLLLVAACADCTAAAPTGAPVGTLGKMPPYRIVHVESGYEIAVQFYDNRDVLNLEARQHDATPVASMPMTARIALWRPLLEQLFQEKGRRADYVLTVQGYSELNSRMAAAAAASDIWNGDTGAPRAGNVRRAVLRLLNEAPLYPELVTLFGPLGYEVTAVSAENIVLRRWSEIASQPAGGTRVDSKIAQNARLPYGASIVFRLKLRGSN